MDRRVLKLRAIKLREQGKSYKEICTILDVSIPKSTMAEWLKGVNFPQESFSKFRRRNLEYLSKIQKLSVVLQKEKRGKYLQDVLAENIPLLNLFNDKGVCKIALAMLYLGEGFKSGSRAGFANSDPKVIILYLKLLQRCYETDPRKYRVTIQCRSDQDLKLLEIFWQKITGIPKEQFYKTRIDPRTIGVKTLKTHYKGVCRVEYFSHLIFDDIMQTIKVLLLGP